MSSCWSSWRPPTRPAPPHLIIRNKSKMSSKQQTKYILFFSFILYFPIITYNSNISKSWFDCEYVIMWPYMGLTSTLKTAHIGGSFSILVLSAQNWEELQEYLKFPLAPMGVLGPGSAHARPSAQPLIDTSGNFPVHVFAKSPSNIWGRCLKVTWLES